MSLADIFKELETNKNGFQNFKFETDEMPF